VTFSARPALADLLGLEPHPEGGWYRRTWHSEQSFSPDGYDGPRPAATAIYFLLSPGETSQWHVVKSDEIWLFHRGGPLILRLGGNGDEPDEPGAVSVLLGDDLAAGARPQLVVPGGVWQTASPATDEAALVSCVVAPGFDFADFRLYQKPSTPGVV
jgi:uncharacterized protein